MPNQHVTLLYWKPMITILLLLFSTSTHAMTATQFDEIKSIAYEKFNEYVPVNKAELDKQINEIQRQFYTYPDAIVIGVMAKCQHVVGVCAATQLNVGYLNGNLHASLYGIGGASLGIAETLKVEIYIALCYGDCLGGLAQGIYIGADGGLSLGGGFAGFIEIGTDITELFGFGRELNYKDFWTYKTLYMGVAYNVGAGIGISGNLYYYKNIWNKDISLKEILDIKL